MRTSLRLLFIATLLLCVAASARAQNVSVAGTVTDETKSVLPGVTVTAADLDTGRQFTAVTDVKGEYRLLNVPAGNYKLQAELSGFATVVLAKVELLVGQNATIPFTLKIAQVSETLTVLGESPLVDTSSSQVAGNVDRRQMEELPLQGRNWMELSKLVKGITANDVGNTPGVSRDDDFQLNLDGQQITQKIAGSGFGQPKFSRESIAEFQIVTNMFDITQGRSTGIEVQAISRSGTNKASGSVYGFFRSDKFNAADPVANKVLPYQNQQVGGALGGPIVKDKVHFFAAYEYEREPGTIFTAPALLPGQSFTIPYKNGQKSLLARVDDQLSSKDRLTLRGSRWDWANPFVLGAGGHPSNASDQTKSATNLVGIWSKVLSDTKVQEIRIGYNNFDWTNAPEPGLENTIEYDFVGLTIGKPYNYPQLFHQNNFESRYDLNLHKSNHDLKLGGEFIYVRNTGTWYIQQVGRMIFNSNPSAAVLNALFPQGSENNPAQWNLAGIPVGNAKEFDQNFHPGDWSINVPRPTWAAWIGDNWRVSNQFTINYGVRWDDDWGVASPPNVVTNSILLNNNAAAAPARIPGMVGTDFGYKDGIRDNRNVAPRAGFTYNVGARNDLVIRGGTGLYFTTPVSNMTFSPQIYSQMITAAFLTPASGKCADGSAWITNPACGVTTFTQAKAVAPAQSPRIISPDYQNPVTWSSSIGFQKQVNDVTGIEADLTHFSEYHDTRTIDPNLFFNPATGYNQNPAAVNGVANRPNTAYTQIAYFVSTGHRDQTQLSMALNRRYKKNFQMGATYTLMFSMHDEGPLGYTSPSQNNVFNYLDGEYATATDFQRNTLRLWTLYKMPWDISAAVSYFYGSGNRFANTIAVAVYGKPGTNRLNLTASGAATNAIVIPATATLANGDVIDIASRYDGPSTIASGDTIPRDALEGLPLHKVDLRLQKEIKLHGSVRLSLIAEVYNLFNHRNYGSYNVNLSATSAATTANFGQPQQNLGNAYVPREAQFAFRVGF
ncbi:MAG TPA: carboxypeptidase-like regulatory domain-containing protein [Vicinamibacterales bacterium]|nr:carboxypeptidase-like regulatory domain-containing protein [Vicinamibacterales bacterium]